MKMRRIIVTTALLISFVAMAGLPAGAQVKIPRIGIEKLKELMDKGTAMTIIDVQSRDVYDMGHIKGAISIPWKSQIDLESVWSLPAEELIVTYCDCGPGEADSDDVARQLFHMGYENVKVLEDPAIQGWREAGYPIEKKN
ncbi:MAG TPA: rhodanese-like domain-containing protein [Acidobacteriota bacterium]|nr:rhodanese-like domain-containing protein [Acidobacteriota bacterium]